MDTQHFELAGIFGQQLIKGLDSLDIRCSEAQKKLLLSFLKELGRWNSAYNLSAIKDPQAMVNLHLIDSLAVSPFVLGRASLIDVGSGAGLPGIPLAILFPDMPVTVVDSVGKKMRFAKHIKRQLKLDNLSVIHDRIEHVKPSLPYGGVISRAFASLEQMLALCGHLVDNEGLFFAMKGKKPESELSQIEKHYIVTNIHDLKVPGINAERCLIVIKKRFI